MRICQLLRAPHDRNGNPRRLWIIYEVPKGKGPGDIAVVGVIDEGYRGRPDVARVPELPNMNITATEYRDWKRFAKEQNLTIAWGE